MATSHTATAGLEPNTPAVVQASAAAPAATAVPAAKATGTDEILKDDLGFYRVVRSKTPDGTIVKRKQRIPSTTEDVAKPAAAPVTTPPVETPAPAPTAAAVAAKVAKPASQQVGEDASKATTATDSGTTVESRRDKTRGRFLQRLSENVLSRSAVTVAPDWDLGDVNNGDNPSVSDEHIDSDDYSSDSDNEGAHSPNRRSGSETVGAKNDKTFAANELLVGAASTGSAALAGSLGKPDTPQLSAPTKVEKEKPSKPVEQNEKSKPHVSERSAIDIHAKQIKNDSYATEEPQQTIEPRPISKTSILIRLSVWTIMIGFPIMFIVLGILTRTVLNNQRTDKYDAAAIKIAITMAITTWPIVFAAVVAQSLKTLATWRVERGIKLMRLEQLIGSHSVASAIRQPFFDRRVDFFSIGLIFLWSLSPLASQALQRMTYIVPGCTIMKPFSVYYVDTTGENIGLHNSTSRATFGQAIAIMYAAALLPQDLVLPYTDNYDNPIIPILKNIQNPKKNRDDWTVVNITLPTVNEYVGYSTIFGIPIENYSRDAGDGVQEFPINSSYFDVNCSAPEIMAWPSFLEMNLTFKRAASNTLFLRWEDTSAADPKTFSFASVRPEDPDLPESTDCLYSDDYYSPVLGCANSTLTYSSCSFERTFVDSFLNCKSDDGDPPICYVTSMRLTPNPPQLTNNDSTMDISDLLISIEPSYAPGIPTIMERWLYRPNAALEVLQSQPVDLSNLDAATFTQRFALLTNTFLQIGFSPVHVAGHLNHTATGDPTEAFLTVNNATYIDNAPVYRVVSSWLVLLFVCSFILLATGVASAVFETLTVGPDVLGFASSVVRQSRHVRVPGAQRGGSAVSGPERARRMRDVRVMMQDVRPDRSVGKIALRTISENTKPLDPRRLYA